MRASAIGDQSDRPLLESLEVLSIDRVRHYRAVTQVTDCASGISDSAFFVKGVSRWATRYLLP